MINRQTELSQSGDSATQLHAFVTTAEIMLDVIQRCIDIPEAEIDKMEAEEAMSAYRQLAILVIGGKL